MPLPGAGASAVGRARLGFPAAVLLAVLVLLVSGCLAAPVRAPGPTARSEAVSGGTATAANGTMPGRWGRDGARFESSRAVVERRVSALAAGDREAWLAPVRGTALRREQAAVFDRMRSMGVRALQVDSMTYRDMGAGSSWQVEVAFNHQLAGMDTAPRRFTVELTMSAGPGPDRAPTMIGSEPADRAQPWDLAGLRVHGSADGLVLATGGPGRLADVAARYTTARAAVIAVWGTAHPAVVVAPSTRAQAAQLLGRDPDALDGVAAVTDGPLTAGTGAGADRIVIVPDAWAALTEQGREVVLAHELTHVTMRSTATRQLPLWLSEGFAEYVAYHRLDLTEQRIVAGALDLVRRDGRPSSWPSAADFQPENDRLSAAYGLSLLAVRSIADRHGQAALVRLCRAASGSTASTTKGVDRGGPEDADAVTDRAIRQVLRSDPEAERLAWQRRIERLLAP